MIPEYRVWDIKAKKMMPVVTLVWNSVTGDFKGAYVEEQGKVGYVLSSEKLILLLSTGRRDKNNKIVFAGDLLRDPNGKIEMVYWDNHAAGFYIGIFNRGRSIDYKGPYRCEITGNMYENSELLEKVNE